MEQLKAAVEEVKKEGLVLRVQCSKPSSDRKSTCQSCTDRENRGPS